MPKRNDGNEQDLRVRPKLDAKSLDADNPYNGNDCETHGEQVDLLPDGSIDDGLVIDGPDGTLTYDWRDVTDVCPTGFSPLQVDRLFVRILKNHFKNENNIIDPYLKRYTYSDDDELSKIAIIMNTTFDVDQTNKMPTLVVKRGKQVSNRIAMGDFGESGSPLLGTPHYVRFISGSHRVLCLGGPDGFIESLAFEVWNILTCLSPAIRRDLPMHDFEVKQMSEAGLVDSLGNTLAVGIDSQYAYEYGWTLTEVAPTLNAVRASATAAIDQVTLESSDGSLRNC